MAEDLLTDDEQLENLKHWFLENGPWLAGGVVLGAALLFGLRYYDSYRNQQALTAATKFNALNTALEKNDRAAARNIAGDLKKDYSSTPYADQADLMIARLAVDSGELANAVEPLTRVMNGSRDAELKNIARLRLARVLIDQGKFDEAINTLSAAQSAAFGARFHEVRGDAFYAKKDTAGALREYQAALADLDNRGFDRGLVELKITDLGAVPNPPLKSAAAKVAP
jgi:predicted negative regulator of RcsB-dependent stress response